MGGPRHRRVVLVLAGVLALSSADTGAIGALAVQIKQDLHVDNAAIGLLASTSSIVGVLATIPVGVLVDRVRRTRLLAGSIALWAVAMVAGGAAPSYELLLASRLFLGAVNATAGPAVASLTGDYFRPDRRGRIWGFILTGDLIGTGIGFIGAGEVAALASWRWALAMLGPLALGLAWFVWRLAEPTRRGESEPEADAPESLVREAVEGAGIEPDPALRLPGDPARMPLWAAVRYVLRIRTNVVLIIASAIGYFFFAGLRTFALTFVRGQYHLSQAAASSFIPVVGIGALAGVLVGGRLGDRLIRRGRLSGRLVVGAAGYLLATAFFLPALLATSVVVAVPLLVIAAAGLAAPNPPMDAARLDIVHPRLWGRAEAVRTVLRSGAEAISPLAFGLAAQSLAGGGTRGLQLTFLIMLAALAANGLVLLLARGSYPRDVASATAAISRRVDRRAGAN